MSERLQITYKYLPEHLEIAFGLDAKIYAVVDEFPPCDDDGSGTWLASIPFDRDMDFEWNDSVPEGLKEKLTALEIPKEIQDWAVDSFEIDYNENDDLDD